MKKGVEVAYQQFQADQKRGNALRFLVDRKASDDPDVIVLPNDNLRKSSDSAQRCCNSPEYINECMINDTHECRKK